MAPESDAAKLARFEAALRQLIERVAEDRYVLVVVLVGSLCLDTIWRRDSISLWIIEADGVTRRLRSDGDDERIFRTLVENGINIHAELIPRSRFRKMVEGSSRTAFAHNFFAKRELVHCTDASLEGWFEQANSVATRDQEQELLTSTVWTIHSHRHARRRLDLDKDLDLVRQQVLGTAHSVAHTEVVRQGEVWEQEAIYRAIDGDPGLFQTIYLDVLANGKSRQVLEAALDAVGRYLEEHAEEHLKPLSSYLKKRGGEHVPLSEISDHFAFSQLYPWHLESVCEWLEEKGRLDKLSAPFKLTKRSRTEVEEPAYMLDV